jgi:hypothetical protein
LRINKEQTVGIRETLNQNPGITTGATAGIIIIALGFIIWQTTGGEGSYSGPTKRYYVDDDGKSEPFLDSVDKIAPFDHNGKQAVLAHVFTCDGGKTKFIGYVERYTPDAKAKLEKARTNPKEAPPPEDMAINGIEIKRPKDTAWLKTIDPRSTAVTKVTCSSGTLEPVVP